MESKKTEGKRGFIFTRAHLCIPYALFLALFVIIPLLFILYYAFTSRDNQFTLENFKWFFSNWSSIKTLLLSIGLSLVTTLCCLIIAYPIAYILAKMKTKKNIILLLLFIMPMWINFVLRAMAMKELLNLFGWIGKYNYLNTIIGMIYDYLPFMVLPLFTTLSNLDKSLEEAATDLGANKFKVFTRVTFPLSLPGVFSGITMVFLPCMTCYVISDTFGNGKVTIIGKYIEQWFGTGDNWHYGSIIALILIIIMFLGTLLTGGFSEDKNVKGVTL